MIRRLISKALSSGVNGYHHQRSRRMFCDQRKGNNVLLGGDKMIAYRSDLLQLNKAYKVGSLDLKLNDGSSNAWELKSMKSLVSVSKVSGMLATGEGSEVSIFNAFQFVGEGAVTPAMTEKTNVNPLSKNNVNFKVIHLVFNNVENEYLAVAGYEECKILMVNHQGEVTRSFVVELGMQGAHILGIDWVPGSELQFVVVTNKGISIFEVLQEKTILVNCFTLPEDRLIVDASLVVTSEGKRYMLVLSVGGCLYRVGLRGDVGAKLSNEVIKVKGVDSPSKGLSLCYSSADRLLFLSYEDGSSMIGRLDANATSITEVSSVFEAGQYGKSRAVGLCHWKELHPGASLFSCFSSKSNALFTIFMYNQELFAQSMSTLPVAGITVYKAHCLVLLEDGYLHIFSHFPQGANAAASWTLDQVKAMGSGIFQQHKLWAEKYKKAAEIAAEKVQLQTSGFAEAVDRATQPETRLMGLTDRFVVLGGAFMLYVHPLLTYLFGGATIDTVLQELEKVMQVLSTIQGNEKEMSKVLSSMETREIEMSNVLTSILTKETEMSNVLSSIQTREIEMSNVLTNMQAKETEMSKVLSSMQTREIEMTNVLNNIQAKIPGDVQAKQE